jgi:hypothetical protein
MRAIPVIAAAAGLTAASPLSPVVPWTSGLGARQATIPKPTANQCSQNQYLGTPVCDDLNPEWTNVTLSTTAGWYCCFLIETQDPVLA